MGTLGFRGDSHGVRRVRLPGGPTGRTPTPTRRGRPRIGRRGVVRSSFSEKKSSECNAIVVESLPNLLCVCHIQVVTDRVRCSVKTPASSSRASYLQNPSALRLSLAGRPLEWLRPSGKDASLSTIDQEIAIDRPPKVPIEGLPPCVDDDTSERECRRAENPSALRLSALVGRPLEWL